ncbi:hypothetical protein BMS3Abin10_01815 [bacterium BMS3Abin10]|nr:hypothetical protein BMS3Abin10_01815 [bacterium BMS3Abin10]GBE39040.1 hypothetical protein BMS3Bbin08_01658 [bacterium BMS3Bbin08]
MTGYGRGVAGNFRVETRSTNHRNLYLQINVPSYLYFYEPEIRNIIKRAFSRGRIEIFVTKAEADDIKLTLNRSFAREYYRALVSLKEELSIPGDIGIGILARQKDTFQQEEPDVEVPAFREALETALEELKKSRSKEGKNLVKDMAERLGFLKEHLAQLEGKREDFIAGSRTALEEKLKILLNNVPIDESRIIQETAILIERSDITEEIVRIKSHLKHMSELLDSGDAAGKKLDFLAQELHREINTIGSKSADAGISGIVVDMKHELEKIREQTQNLQ